MGVNVGVVKSKTIGRLACEVFPAESDATTEMTCEPEPSVVCKAREKQV